MGIYDDVLDAFKTIKKFCDEEGNCHNCPINRTCQLCKCSLAMFSLKGFREMESSIKARVGAE